MTTGEQKYLSDFARKYYGEGRDAGIAEGKAQGVALGKEEGVALGKAEGVALGKAEGVALGKAEGVALGKADGIRQALFTVFTARAIPLSEEQRATLTACTDVPTLERWLARAAQASTASEVF